MSDAVARPVTERRRREFWLAFGAIAIVLAAGLGLRDPWPADEPRFALIARTMVETGNWLFPQRGIELYAEKPPLFMWLQALSFLVVRAWRVAFLLPSLAAALGTLALVYDLVRRLSTRRAATYAMLMLGSTILFAFQARAAQIDASVTFLVTLSMYGLLRHLLLGPDWRWYALGFAAAGAGVAMKGVGFLSLLVLLPYAWARLYRWRHITRVRWRDWRWALGPVMFVLPLLLWLVPMLFAVKLAGDPAYDAYARELLVRQTAQRYAASWHHAQPFWYFVPVIALMWIPASLALPWAIGAWRRRLSQRHDARVLLPLAWAALVVVFFSLTPGKREVYILPALPMFVVALAPLLPGLVRVRGFRLLLWGTAAAISAALVGLSLYALFAANEFAEKILAERGIAPWWLTLAIGVAGLAAAIAARPRRAHFAWLGFTAALWLLYGLWGYPMLDAARSGRAVMVRAGEIIGPDAELGLVAWKEQNLLHAGRAVTDFGFTQPPERQREAALRWLAEAPAQRWLFIQDDAFGRCIDRTRAQVVGVSNRRAWFLVRHDAVVPRCADGASKPPGDEAQAVAPT
ncbi:MAG TPA: glycosyltransferase family 39 protein [Candidatus Saccharimonadia bacterium]|nr:glycosyltransferase family 39 protein [Candidatus Saccharimonadia bacterium]